MSWEVLYTIRNAGNIGQAATDSDDADAKIQAATTSQQAYLDIDGVKVRREDVIVVQKREKNSP